MRSILGIDTASPEGSVALEIDGAPAGSEPLSAGGHSSGLSAAVGRLLASRRLAIGSLQGIAVSEGPGSFTGLRIGLAWAKGVAMGASLRLALVSAHEAAAHAHRDATARDPKARVATVTQGERGFVVAALWNRGNPVSPGNPGDLGDLGASLAWGPEAVPDDEFMERLLAAAGGATVLVAAPTDALAEAVLDLGGTPLPRRALAGAVAALGDRAIRAGKFADVSSAAPVYGRAPNARKPGSA